jgi:hypothetical protein
MESITKTEFGKAMGLSKGRVSQLIGKGLPVIADGRIPLDRARAWYEGTIHKTARKRGPRESKKLPAQASLPASIRLLEAQASKEEQLAILRTMEVQRRKGELLDAADVERAWSRMLIAARNRMLLLPDKLAPHLVNLTDVLEIRELIRKEVYAALTALSQYNPEEGK